MTGPTDFSRRVIRLAGRPRVTSLVASLLAVVAFTACGPFGDPGPPVAVQGSGTERLGAVLLLLCPGERVLSVTVSVDTGGGGAPKPGAVLWELEAVQPSSVSKFVVGADLDGFRTTVSPPAAIAGSIVISFKTTTGAGDVGIKVRDLPPDVVWFEGHRLTEAQFYAKGKDRC